MRYIGLTRTSKVKNPGFAGMTKNGVFRLFTSLSLLTNKQVKTYLNDEDRSYITEVFFDDIVPKLKNLQARIGTINCEFAGEAYKNWIIYFKSTGSGFYIVDFEYDENSCSFSLDP